MPSSFNVLEAVVKYTVGSPAVRRGQTSFPIKSPRTETLDHVKERVRQIAKERLAKERSFDPSCITLQEIIIS